MPIWSSSISPREFESPTICVLARPAGHRMRAGRFGLGRATLVRGKVVYAMATSSGARLGSPGTPRPQPDRKPSSRELG